MIGCSPKNSESSIKNIDSTIISDTINVIVDEVQEQTNEQVFFDKRINLDSILNEEYDYYLSSIEDSLLSIVGYNTLNIIDKIDFNKFYKSIEKYNFDNEVHQIDVFYLGTSFVKKYYNRHPDVMRTDLVCGMINNNTLINGNTIQIGMLKNDLLELVFQPTQTFDKVIQFNIYEDETGEAFTSYIFENDTLKNITFDSDYSWIEKGIK